MIAKLIVHAPSRHAAAARLSAACAEVEVWPIKTNAAFLARAASRPEFVAGHIDTGFIENHLTQLVPLQETPDAVFVAAAHARLDEYGGPRSVWSAGSGFRVNAATKSQVEVQTGSERRWVSLAAAGTPLLRSTKVGDQTIVFARGDAFTFGTPQSLAVSTGAATEGAIRAPMPGKIIALQIADGAAVVKGQPLVTMEAMKMEHTLTAPFDGFANDLALKLGDQVSEGTALLRITRKPTSDDASLRTHPA
jgi:3-methylcrotonyl-CoA carboxylase alpha subunit